METQTVCGTAGKPMSNNNNKKKEEIHGVIAEQDTQLTEGKERKKNSV